MSINPFSSLVNPISSWSSAMNPGGLFGSNSGGGGDFMGASTGFDFAQLLNPGNLQPQTIEGAEDRLKNDPAFFNKLDTGGKGGKGDGVISDGDLKKVMNDKNASHADRAHAELLLDKMKESGGNRMKLDENGEVHVYKKKRRGFFKRIGDAFKKIGNGIKKGFQAIGSAVKSGFNAIKSVCMGAINSIKSMVTGGFAAFTGVIGGILTGDMNKIKEGVNAGIKGVSDSVTHAAKGATDCLKHVAAGAGSLVGGLTTLACGEKVGNFIGNMTQKGLGFVETMISSTVNGLAGGIQGISGVMRGEGSLKENMKKVGIAVMEAGLLALTVVTMGAGAGAGAAVKCGSMAARAGAGAAKGARAAANGVKAAKAARVASKADDIVDVGKAAKATKLQQLEKAVDVLDNGNRSLEMYNTFAPPQNQSKFSQNLQIGLGVASFGFGVKSSKVKSTPNAPGAPKTDIPSKQEMRSESADLALQGAHIGMQAQAAHAAQATQATVGGGFIGGFGGEGANDGSFQF